MSMISRLTIPVAAALVSIAGMANAAVTTLQSVTPTGDNFVFSYQSTMGPDEGIVAGNRFVIFDFAGYVDGSIFAGANFTTSTELTTSTPFIIPTQTDDTAITNLVFTYNGAPINASGGPFPSFTFATLGATSIFSDTVADAFTSFTVKNSPNDVEGTAIITLGSTQVPLSGSGTGIIPEPATWALMIAGFGMVGVAARRRRHSTTAVAA